ncbi:MAG: triphosphoribosyl-dephospho-CoA synthase, partial [Halobacteria archaeon]|nr:triphosphoribosyl-dephospho-CoA synthase [Halobacteria archaeon]
MSNTTDTDTNTNTNTNTDVNPGSGLTPAQTAQLAMLLDVGSDPKPGNVDRGHGHDDADTTFHHFLGSAVGAVPAFERAAKSADVGETFYDAVESAQWHSGGNTHFGALLLLVPLVIAEQRDAGIGDVVAETTVEDAVRFYEAFDLVDVHVEPRDELGDENDLPDVNDENAVEEVRARELTLYDVMETSAPVDGVAREWTKGFERCFDCAEYLNELSEEYNNTND